ncbi:hypothetical protein [Halarcobacter anaerophilus]|uniref:hypothetical protein n=1 Tax=Halarcobacter anaerophilus TaxID=877500 RepID=UPI000697FFED|nr:hypothetical protein [Halarcobacter anaerophilus]
MKENLEELQKQGIDIPVLLGGAALTKRFVNDYCRPLYDGPIFIVEMLLTVLFYAKNRRGDLSNTALAADLVDEDAITKPKEEEVIVKEEEVELPVEAPFTFPPLWGRVAQNRNMVNKDLALNG